MSQEDTLLPGENSGNVAPQNADKVERSDIVPILASEPGLPEDENSANNSRTITRKYVPVLRMHKPRQCQNKKRIVIIILGCVFVFLSLVFLVTGTIRFNQCHPQKIFSSWDKRFLGVHFNNLVSVNNFALERKVNQSSMSFEGTSGPAQLAVDGDIKTCSRTDAEVSPRLLIDLNVQRPIGFILIHGSLTNALHDITIYVIGEEETFGRVSKNICHQQKGIVNKQMIATDCERSLNGRYIVIEMTNTVKKLDKLMICEVIVIQR